MIFMRGSLSYNFALSFRFWKDLTFFDGMLILVIMSPNSELSYSFVSPQPSDISNLKFEGSVLNTSGCSLEVLAI